MSSVRVLLAGDDRDGRELAATLLRSALPQTRVTVLAGGVELGLELADEGRAVLVTDASACGLGLLDLLATVRRLRPEWAVVLVAGAIEPVLLSDALRAGLAGYLPAAPAGWRRLPELVAELVQPREAVPVRGHDEMEEFASIVGHDLQEPLQLITRYGRMVRDDCGDGLGADGRRYVEHMVASAQRLQTMVDGLLEYSRVVRRGRPPSRVSLEDALDEALANLEDVLQAAGATVTRDPLPAVAADPGQMVQLFQNLLTNAVKFRGEAAPRVHVAARVGDGRVRLALSDNGIGIDPAHHRRIFGMFQRLHTADEVDGSGIGLAVCARIVERHGGTIGVESEPGAGATFHVELPLDAVPPAAEGEGSHGS